MYCHDNWTNHLQIASSLVHSYLPPQSRGVSALRVQAVLLPAPGDGGAGAALLSHTLSTGQTRLILHQYFLCILHLFYAYYIYKGSFFLQVADWLAYPEYSLQDDLNSFILAPGLYYTSRWG